MITCAEAVRRLWEHLEGELEAPEEARVEEHLALCRRCCGEAEFTAELQAMLRSTPGPTLTEEIEAQLLDVLAELEGQAG